MQPEQSPYDFILNAGDPPKRSVLPSSGPSSPFKRGLLVGGIALVVIILTVLFMSVIKGGGGSRTALLAVAQRQAETVRVADMILAGADSQTVKNVSVNVYLGLTSDQKKLAAIMNASGITINEKELLLGKDPKTDELLDNAKTAGTYDATAVDSLKEQIGLYETSLSSAYSQVEGPNLKTTIKENFANAELLKKQLESTKP